MINGDDIYGENVFIEGFELLQNVDDSTSIIGGLKLKDSLPESGKVNRGVVFVEENKVVGMKEILNIDSANTKHIEDLGDMIANVNFIGLQNNALEKINNLNVEFKKKNEGDMKIESLLTDHINSLIINKDIKMEYFVIKNKIYGITNPEDEESLKNILCS